jgi:hypothetical protein
MLNIKVIPLQLSNQQVSLISFLQQNIVKGINEDKKQYISRKLYLVEIVFDAFQDLDLRCECFWNFI